MENKVDILWLDDDLESIETEAYILLPDKFGDKISIKTYTKIANLIEEIDNLGLEKVKNSKNIVFLIDLMLIGERQYISFDKEEKFIKDELVAGIEFYQNSLIDFNNYIIFYTSRRYDKSLFENIIKSKENLYFVEKDKKESDFINTLVKIIDDILTKD